MEIITGSNPHKPWEFWGLAETGNAVEMPDSADPANTITALLGWVEALNHVLSGREVVKIFEADGWRIARQRRSHIILVKDGHISTLSVPDHREVAKETLRSLIRASGLTPDEFISLIGE
jgi:predicted RNA binding protein YcfA (HicA-like mRNA interferase family)